MNDKLTHTNKGEHMSDLLEKIENGVAVLTMNRPESLNALSAGMMADLSEAVPRLAEDPAVKVIVLTGAGRGFCAGGDVKGMANRNEDPSGSNTKGPTIEQKAQSLRKGMEVSRILYQCSKPTIAMMRGPAAGAGLSLGLACDMRVASKTIRFTTAFVNVGASGDYGGSYFLTKLVGGAKARELYFTGRKIESDEALQLGIVNHLVEDDALEAKTMELANQIARGPTVALQYMKQNLNAAETGTLEQVFDMEASAMVRTMMTDDHKEAARAFVEKRAPNFSGE
ncbi:MAG: 2-(1,2-epoxy-1,2-dihydrophenyl)acetyl-CoA isomerase [Candidatus Azotimanducaceae bacterium]